MVSFTDRHRDKIVGVLSCFDRVVITGTIPVLCHVSGMAGYLTSHKIRIFDYPRWAEPLREEVRNNAEHIAQENGLEIDFIRRRDFRKDKRIRKIIEARGAHPGLIHIFSAMEPCPSYKPWHDKRTHKTFLKPIDAKCLHYYFFFILEDLGLCYLRVPTWAPFRLQFYYNGHNEQASRLKKQGIGFKMLDNAFESVDDFEKAQRLANTVSPRRLHHRIDRFAWEFCPVIRHFQFEYHWSQMQVEYATDIIFKSREALKPIYEDLVRTAIHSVKPENVATFLGRKLSTQFEGEIGSDYHTRIEGTRIKHYMQQVSIKMYDKRGKILRIETVVNNVSFFKHYRRVEHRDGTWSMKDAPVKKSIYSMPVLCELMGAANRRYLEFISCIDDPNSGFRDLDIQAR